jgi:hypothetical protein
MAGLELGGVAAQEAGSHYDSIIARVFFRNVVEGASAVDFSREQIHEIADELGIQRVKNIGDLIYTFRFRRRLPSGIAAKAPEGKAWVLRLAGSGRYRFVATAQPFILPNELIGERKVPDATPSIIERDALSDEQALLAKLGYNRLIDITTGITCSSLQNHLRTQIPDMGQIETDEVYVGLDRRGIRYVLPAQAKGGNDRLSVVQIEQDTGLCMTKFPHLVCTPVAARFMAGSHRALRLRGHELRVASVG